MADMNRLRSYLPKEDTSKVSETQALIDRANALESTRDLLMSEYNILVPEDGANSIKLRCPYAFEHKDGGKDKGMRYYFDSDSAFCFRDHGVIDPVFIRSMKWGETRLKTAKIMLEKAGVFKREHYSVRMTDMLSAEKTKTLANQPYAFEALNLALRNESEYVSHQFNPKVVSAKNRCLESFNPAWTLQDIEKWITASIIYVKQVAHAQEGLR